MMPTRRKTPAGETPRRNPSALDNTTAPPTPTIPTEHDIARRAYELFVERGAVHGRDRDDWLSAERELRGSF
jgi:Protein of unknown function (DUF2934)